MFPFQGMYLVQLDYLPRGNPSSAGLPQKHSKTSSLDLIKRRLIFGVDPKTKTSKFQQNLGNLQQDLRLRKSNSNLFTNERANQEIELDDIKKIEATDEQEQKFGLELDSGLDTPEIVESPPQSPALKAPSPIEELYSTGIQNENNQGINSKDHIQTPEQQTKSLIKKRLLGFAKMLMTPQTITLIVSIIIALVPRLKGLFVTLPSDNYPPAPDGLLPRFQVPTFLTTFLTGLPPLSIILQVSQFLGGASVPLGLMVLGCSLTQIKIQRPIVRMPILAIVSLGLWKLVILPVLGVLLEQGLVKHTGLVPKENTVLRFVLIYFACV
jgi:hypothetical protein